MVNSELTLLFWRIGRRRPGRSASAVLEMVVCRGGRRIQHCLESGLRRRCDDSVRAMSCQYGSHLYLLRERARLRRAIDPIHVCNVWAMDEELIRQLVPWPTFRRLSGSDAEAGDFANHCPHCGRPQETCSSMTSRIHHSSISPMRRPGL
jgi:hypothetical protein